MKEMGRKNKQREDEMQIMKRQDVTTKVTIAKGKKCEMRNKKNQNS